MKRLFLLVAVLFLALPIQALAAVSPGPLVIADAQTNTITMAWDPNSESDLGGYYIYSSRTSGSGYSKIGQIGMSASPSFTTPALGNGKWYFVVTAYNTAGMESGYSNEVSATISVAPAAPRNLIIRILQAIAMLFTRMFGLG